MAQVIGQGLWVCAEAYLDVGTGLSHERVALSGDARREQQRLPVVLRKPVQVPLSHTRKVGAVVLRQPRDEGQTLGQLTTLQSRTSRVAGIPKAT